MVVVAGGGDEEVFGVGGEEGAVGHVAGELGEVADGGDAPAVGEEGGLIAAGEEEEREERYGADRHGVTVVAMDCT
jgi:hypothetical protein